MGAESEGSALNSFIVFKCNGHNKVVLTVDPGG